LHRKEINTMPRTRTRCAACPAAQKKANETALMRPLFLDEATAWPPADPQTQRQAHALREAIAPYLCVNDLRRLAASGASVLDALKHVDGVPDEVEALMRLLEALLAPGKEERITRPADLAALLMLEMGHLDHEEFWVACLDTKNHVQRLHRLYKGSLNSSVVRVGEVFQLPILLKSASIIVAHNHPAGTTLASKEDLEVTHLLVQAGTLLQIELLDHLIIGQGVWMSMHERGLGW
jgi:DNA repair protein RadC